MTETVTNLNNTLKQIRNTILDQTINKRLTQYNLQLQKDKTSKKLDKNRKSRIIIKLGKPFLESDKVAIDNSIYHEKAILKRGRPRTTFSNKSKKGILLGIVEVPNKRQRLRIRKDEVYSDLLKLIFVDNGLYLSEIQRYIPEPKRSLIRHLNELIKLKWVYKYVKGYYLNPFLQFMIDNSPKEFSSILDYAEYKIDLFKLLNYPLKLIEDPIEFEQKIVWQMNPKNKFQHDLKTEPHMGPIFFGILRIYAKMKDGLEVQTFLPINIHPQHSLKGKTDSNLDHFCIPTDWSLFDIQSSKTFSGRETFIHFDNSMTISYHQRAIWFRKPLVKAIAHWSGEGNEYIETLDSETLERLFNLRFGKGLRRLELFKEMGLQYKRFERKPQ